MSSRTNSRVTSLRPSAGEGFRAVRPGAAGAYQNLHWLLAYSSGRQKPQHPFAMRSLVVAGKLVTRCRYTDAASRLLPRSRSSRSRAVGLSLASLRSSARARAVLRSSLHR